MRRFIVMAWLGMGIPVLGASMDTLILKDRAVISGRILAEKRDLVVVDIGYTVLTVPRNQIQKITADKEKTSEGQSISKVASVPAPVRTPDLYHTAANPSERPVQELVKELGEAVVQIKTPEGLGSGFILTEDGYLITNFHVIEGESHISVEVYHQRGGQLERKTYRQIQIVAMNKFADLALLKIQDQEAVGFKLVPLGSTDNLAVGDRVFAIGSPLGLERTVTEGIVSTKTRELQGSLYLQTTAQINPGNSGGPLFNLRGEVIGVTSMKTARGEGIGFAIPVDTVRYFLAHRDAYAYDKDNPNNPYRYLSPPSRLLKSNDPQP